MSKLGKLLLTGVISATILASAAQARDFASIYTECGLGAMIAPKVPVVAAITNVTWDLGTTAITSEISSKGTCAGQPEKVASFINTSYEQLENELAKGEGKYLDTLVSMTKPENVTKEAFVATLRSDFSNVVASNGTRYQKSEALYNMVN